MKTKPSFNIIGDIHGRVCWRELVHDECVNIFVGDYFDPYDDTSYVEVLHNFIDIIEYKRLHPQTVLLYGNHDLHYLSDADRGSRYDWLHAAQTRQVLTETNGLFHGVAYAIGESVLVSHAGVTKEWYEKQFGTYHGEPLAEVAQNINELWEHNKREFSFMANTSDGYDVYGESPTHSPMWIRPWALAEHNLFAGTAVKQVFGHTQMEDIRSVDDSLVCVDCLGTCTKSFFLA